MISSIVDQQTITHNPAYDEGNYVHIITLYSSYYDHYIVTTVSIILKVF